MENKKFSKIENFIRKIMKGKSEHEINEAMETYEEYILLVNKICNRVENENMDAVEFHNQ
jgi:hypothetical protein